MTVVPDCIRAFYEELAQYDVELWTPIDGPAAEGCLWKGRPPDDFVYFLHETEGGWCMKSSEIGLYHYMGADYLNVLMYTGQFYAHHTKLATHPCASCEVPVVDRRDYLCLRCRGEAGD